MLVLSRNVDQSIVIDGGRVVVTVVAIRGGTVRLGVMADDGVVVDRYEVHLQKGRDAELRRLRGGTGR